MDLTAAKISDNPVNDSMLSEIVQLRNKLSSSNAPVELKENSMRNIDRLERMAKWGNYSSEFEGVDKYVDWVTRIPWGSITEDNLNIENAKQLMDSTHYGMDVVKNLILDYLAVMQLQKSTASRTPVTDGNMQGLRGSSANAPVLLFLGLQGVM